MDSTNDFSSLPIHLQKELRAHLASLNIKLTLASDQLAKETDAARQRELRDEIARLKAEAKRVAEAYVAGKTSPEAAPSPDDPLDVVLVFEEIDGPTTAPLAAEPRGTQPLALEDLPILFEIEEAERPPATSGPLVAPPSDVAPLEEVAITLDFRGEPSRAPEQPAYQRGGRLGEALAYAAEAAARRAGGDVVARALARPLEAAALAIDQGAGEDEVVAAALLDAVTGPEDEPGLAEIRELFGEHVGDTVAAGAALRRIDPWEQRDRGYMTALAEAPAEAVRVAIRARMCGVTALARQCRAGGAASLGGDPRGLERLFWSLRALSKAYRSVASGPIVDEWDRAVADLEQSAK